MGLPAHNEDMRGYDSRLDFRYNTLPPRLASNWPLRNLAAKPSLKPFPGWVLGSGQSASIPTGLRKKLWRLLRSPFEVEWLEGLQLTLYPGNEICRSVFVTGCYEPNEFCLLSRILKPGMLFVDVGANIGLYTLFAARHVTEQGRVIAIEPSNREMAILRNNVVGNALRNVTLFPVALSDHAAEVDLLVAPTRHAGHNTLGAFGYNTPLDHRERISTVRLDDLVETQHLKHVDIIKMDIEGAELAALHGGSETLRKHQPVLLLELSDRALNHQKATSADVLDLLAAHGYRVYGFDGKSGLPVLLEPASYRDSENVVAVVGPAPW